MRDGRLRLGGARRLRGGRRRRVELSEAGLAGVAGGRGGELEQDVGPEDSGPAIGRVERRGRRKCIHILIYNLHVPVAGASEIL